MKLLIVTSLILFSHLALAASTIKPTENDRASTLIKYNDLILSAISKDSTNIDKTQYNHCKYNLNDYRHLKNSEMGCAVNNNIKTSSCNGDICN
ncbi:Uncharacterised protein [Yersinia mollaretii]|uniref:hypothetical protein n=1 Tax=Yersinia mollaretii TaxID=33060 RepID=UPI0005DAC2A0|nr:hypothetical protein [Yersinia mollaretii]CNK45001.1 Uncharacterised protein [Yersinia mollaretii]